MSETTFLVFQVIKWLVYTIAVVEGNENKTSERNSCLSLHREY